MLQGFTSLKDQKVKSPAEMEFANLQKRKEVLLSEISKLSPLYYGLKEGYESFKKKQDDYANSQTEEVLKERKLSEKILDEKTVKLDTLSKFLDEKESFLLEFYDYLADFMQICEATTSQNALQALRNKEELSTIVLNTKDLLKRAEKVKEDEEKVGHLLDSADEKFREADILVKFFRGTVDKERGYLERWRKRLLNKDFELSAREKWIGEEKVRLEERREALERKERVLEIKSGDFK